MDKPRRKSKWKFYAWAVLCLGLLGVVIKNEIQLPPRLPEPIILVDGTIMTIETVEVSSDPKFVPATTFSQTKWARILLWLRNHTILDETPLRDDFTLLPENPDNPFSTSSGLPAVSDARRPPFINPALCVWVSFKDAKTGKYLADPPRLSANLLDGQNIFLVGRMLCDSEGKPLMQTHGEKIAWAFVWDYFPCSSQQFFLAMGTDFSEVCCVPIPNPEVSLRRMPWVSQVAEVPPFQFVDGYEIHYRPPLERNSDSFPEEEKISLFKNGRDVTSETWAYPIRIAQNEWGMPVGGLMGMALTYQVRFEFGEMPLAEFPDGQKLVFHNLSKPEDGQIIAIDRELKDRDEAVRVSALIGRGAYRLRDGHVVGVRPLSEQEAQTGQFQKDSMDIACFAGSELPSGAKNNDTQVCALKPSLLFKADKGLDYYWISASGEVWDPYIHFYQELVPVEWDAAGKQKPWTLAVSKRREVAFYVKRESRADSELGGNHK